MIIGFGDSEIREAKKILKECQDFINGGESFGIGIQLVEKGRMKLSDKYKEMDRSEVPERYTYFFCNTNEIYTDYHIATFTMMHINRRHVGSPDGWGLLQTRWIMTQKEDEFTVYKES